MNNLIISFPKKDNYNFYNENLVDGFFIGIEGYSENFNYLLKESKIKKVIELLESNNKKSYIFLNKVITEDKLDNYKKLLKKLSNLNIEAVIFSDIAVFNIVKENNLDINLIWHSKMVTNSKSINFFEKRGLYGFLTTPQITIDEFIDITKNTKCKAIIKLFGYTNMSTSSRTLISNYFKYKNIDKDPHKKYFMHEKSTNSFYPIIENETTNFFSNKILNGILEYRRLINEKIDCTVFLDDYMIYENQFYNVIEAFIAARNCPTDEEFVNKLKKVIDSNLFNETDNGFLNKKTIFKVK